jgi:LacI family transcriptional regulator
MSSMNAGITNVSPTARRINRKRVMLLLWYYDHRHHAGVARFAAERGWALEDAYTQIRLLPDKVDADGIISFHGNSQPFLDLLKAANCPVVDIGSYDNFSDYPRVKTDAPGIARMAIDYFTQHKYKTVGFVWEFEAAVVEQRKAATRQVAQERGLRYVEFHLNDLPRLREQALLPIGMLAVNDSVAVRALRACEDCGLAVPEEVALMGVDNFEYRCVPASVPLTSIDCNQECVGYEAAALLDRLMAGDDPPAGPIAVPPVGIVERESTGMIAVTDIEVARALRYVIQNYRARISLSDVARSTNLSLRRLQTRFKEQLGKTILQEINSRRIEHAQRLLESTGKRIHQVAGECGFGNSVKLIRVFKQYMGTSPKRYRKQSRRAELTEI